MSKTTSFCWQRSRIAVECSGLSLFYISYPFIKQDYQNNKATLYTQYHAKNENNAFQKKLYNQFKKDAFSVGYAPGMGHT